MALALDAHGGIKLRESDVLKQIESLMPLHGFLCLRLNSGLLQRPSGTARIRIGQPGMPDLVCLHPSKPALFIETKSSKGKLRPVQEIWRDWLLAEGYQWMCVRDIQQVIAWLEAQR